ncbi:hypothetical protein D3C83_169550 [compost metagenome]
MHELRAQLEVAGAIGDREDPATGAVPGFQHRHAAAGTRQVPGSGQARRAGTDDNHGKGWIRRQPFHLRAGSGLRP